MTATAPTPVDRLRAELAPVRQALIEDARAESARITTVARDEAAALVDEAQHETDTAIEQGRRRGEASAQARLDRELEQVRSVVHREILHAGELLHRRLHDAVHAAALDLRKDVRYPALLDSLERQAEGQLGVQVRIERDPDRLGGVVGVAGTRRVDYTLPSLADRALEVIADRVAELWT